MTIEDPIGIPSDQIHNTPGGRAKRLVEDGKVLKPFSSAIMLYTAFMRIATCNEV